MRLSHTHDLICHFKRMEKVLFRIRTLLQVSSVLGGSIWKATTRFSSPPVAQLVQVCILNKGDVGAPLAAPRQWGPAG